MTQEELDEISQSFSEAWNDYFGMKFYVLRNTVIAPQGNLYTENPNPPAPTVIGPINARYLSNLTELKAAEFGLSSEVDTALSFVTKDLRDKGILSLTKKDRVKVVDRDGVETIYIITELGYSTQFLNNFIFINVGIVNE